MEYKISVIIPAYNVAPYVGRCIESVLNQTYINWELILIDDGSTDGTGEICDRYAKKYEKISVAHQPNLGVSTARNNGIEKATGDYLIFIDADDRMAETMLENMIIAVNGGELAVCGFSKVYVDEDGTETKTDKIIWNGYSESFESADVYYEVLTKTGMMCNKLFRRDIVNTVRFAHGMRYGEDTLFIAQVLRNVSSAVLIPKALYVYYINRPGNVVSSKIGEKSNEYLKNSLKIYEEVKTCGQTSCGVYRVIVVINEILAKLKNEDQATTRGYIMLCSKLLQHIKFVDKVRFLTDRRFCGKKRILKFLCLSYCPSLFLLLGRNL